MFSPVGLLAKQQISGNTNESLGGEKKDCIRLSSFDLLLSSWWFTMEDCHEHQSVQSSNFTTVLLTKQRFVQSMGKLLKMQVSHCSNL